MYTEGTITNTLIFTGDGRVYLDGKEVCAYDDAGNKIPHKLFEPRVGYSTYYQDRCPYGSEGDYTARKPDEKNSNIALTQEVQDLATNVFISILCSFFGAGGDLAEQIMGAFYEFLKTTEPHTTSLSYTAIVKAHKNYSGGYIAPIFTYVYKYEITLFSGKNYTGYTKYRKTFKCKLTV